jgi:hypothetical protein
MSLETTKRFDMNYSLPTPFSSQNSLDHSRRNQPLHVALAIVGFGLGLLIPDRAVYGATLPRSQFRFAYTETVAPGGAERLILAEFNHGFTIEPLTARIVSVLSEVVGQSGAIPETFLIPFASPSNRYLVGGSIQTGRGFIDINISTYDMDTGLRVHFFNEHSVGISDRNRANCYSAIFDSWLASRAAIDSPSVLAGYDFRLFVDDPFLSPPTLHWNSTAGIETLLAQYRFEVVRAGFTFDLLGRELFEFQVNPSGGTIRINPGVGYTPNPPSKFAIAPLPTKFGNILFRKSPLPFYNPVRRKYFSVIATSVAGNVAY